MSVRLPLSLLVSLLLVAPPGLRAATAVLEPVRDNTLYEDAGGSKSNGAGEYLFVGKTLEPDDSLRRALIAFDVAGQIPRGSKVISVRLRLNMSRTIAGAVPVSLHRVLAGWGEGSSDAPRQEGDGAPASAGDATWLHRFYDRARWSTPGGDFQAPASARTPVGLNGFYEWGPTPEMNADVRRWLDDPGSNFGWILIGDESVAPTAKRFDSRENLASSNRPQLVVEFEPPVPMARFLPLAGGLRFSGPGEDRFDVAGRFALGDNSDGIDPEAEEVVIRFGSFRQTLPPGSFRCGSGGCRFEAEGPGLTRVLITAESFAVSGREVDLSGSANPVQVGLSIGDDLGRGELRLGGVLRSRPGVRPGEGRGATRGFRRDR